MRQMESSKAPGPDGFSIYFYHNLWHVVGNDILDAVLKVLNDGAYISRWNETLVTLLPKVEHPILIMETVQLDCAMCITRY